MANFTRIAIRETFLELLEQRPLSSITVKDIVERCGINRNSFYYHYHDLPALLEEIIREESDAVIKKYPKVDSLGKCFDAIIDFASHRRSSILHIYRSVSRDVFERHLMENCDYFVRRYAALNLSPDVCSDADRETIICFYKCTCFGLVIDYLERGMREADAKSMRQMFEVKSNMVLELALKLRER